MGGWHFGFLRRCELLNGFHICIKIHSEDFIVNMLFMH